MTATVFRQSYMTQRPSLFTLINYCAIVFSFALIFANGWLTACDGFYIMRVHPAARRLDLSSRFLSSDKRCIFSKSKNWPNAHTQWCNWRGAWGESAPWQAKCKNWAPFTWHFDI